MAYLTISAVGVPVADARSSNGTVVVRIGTPGEGLLSLSPQEALALARGLISSAVASGQVPAGGMAAVADDSAGSVALTIDGEPVLSVPVDLWTRLASEGTSAAFALQGDRLRSDLRKPALQLGNADLVGA